MSGNLLTGLSDNIVIDKTKCVFCGICVDACITDNLRLQLAPCRGACPLQTNCQGYVQAVARGDDALALAIVHRKLPFPAILGRVCVHPCETACKRNETDGQAVAIREIKRFLADRVGAEDYPEVKPAPSTGKRIAVVGAGPAGLIAAFDLALHGHAVALYDAEPEPGGMLRWAIPPFRLPQATLDKEFGQLERLGVTFHGQQRLGAGLQLQALSDGHDAVVLAVGCAVPEPLAGFEADSPGILYGLPFLRAQRQGNPIAVGREVVVIGGGNVAIDAARTARRLGAGVRVVCLEQRGAMPAYSWEVAAAELEGVEIHNGWGPVEPRRDGQVLTGVVCQRCTAVYDAAGAFAPRFDAAQQNYFSADTVIVAVGQHADEIVRAQIGEDVEIDPLTLQLGERPVFAAGDMVSGPSSVVEAMAQGRRAGESAHRLAMGIPLRYGRAYGGPVVTEFAIRTDGAVERSRAEPPRRSRAEEDFDESQAAFDVETARREAARCHSCGQPVGFYRTCWFCLPCEVECPHDALWVEVPYLLR